MAQCEKFSDGSVCRRAVKPHFFSIEVYMVRDRSEIAPAAMLRVAAGLRFAGTRQYTWALSPATPDIMF
jgi:hypothetical protein